MSRTAVLLCPGRGSYRATELGYLSRPAPAEARSRLDAAIDRADGLRTARGDLTIRGMDGAPKFRSELFAGENASALTFACAAFDALRLDRGEIEPVAVGGNSLGWYSALFVGGVLDLDNAFELVETMGGMMRRGPLGAQIIYPLVDDQWRLHGSRRQVVDAALDAVAESGGRAGWSIRYGGFAVLWADDDAVETLLAALPGIELGEREYPLRLPDHSAFHSPLMAAASARGLDQLASLPWRQPALPLIDGRGAQWRPLSCNPEQLCQYTLGTQVLNVFDFTAAVRVALHEYAPERLVLLGPGDTLFSAVAQVLIAERWQGIDSREAFLERQQAEPFVLSMARAEQAVVKS